MSEDIVFEQPEPGQTYGPDMFYSDLNLPDPTTVTNEPLPRAWTEGGIIENVKRAIVTGVRNGMRSSTMANTALDEQFYIDIEYPTTPTQYPGIWVQFGIQSLNRAGLAMETPVQEDDGNWSTIHVWNFTGNITLTCAALSSKDRDRLADTVISNLAFSRPPDLVLRDARRDTQQHKGLITTLDENPYVMMTLNTDVVHSGGQTVTNSVPWANNILLYEDNYSVDCVGQFCIRFSNDGVYTLSELRVAQELMGNNVAYNPSQWR